MDYAQRIVLVRGPEGNLRSYTAGEDVEQFDQLQVGDTVSLCVTEALSMEMMHQ